MDQALWQCTCSLSLPLAWPPWRFPYHGSHHSSLSSKAPSSEKNFCVISEEITPPIKTQCHLSCFVLFLIFLLKQGCQFVPYTSTIMTNPREHIIRLPACLDCLRWHWLIPVAVWLLIALLPNTKIAWSINCITYILNKKPLFVYFLYQITVSIFRGWVLCIPCGTTKEAVNKIILSTSDTHGVGVFKPALHGSWKHVGGIRIAPEARAPAFLLCTPSSTRTV